ncbi:MAG: hypothetical protein PHO13_08555 [Fermentimonas sp.]|nr:hypothetical protein [Fermentimonas sp.]MDD2931541.1 hypothetical protein [Fermentimonas sp.]MDD3189535.1 hypothetical protein [Fermentimonas sp.]MDD4284651.1 hypothetical protein [Fermentimonas sp.]MDD4724769.1 hypothetical protein [Fermentimonas sp.]
MYKNILKKNKASVIDDHSASSCISILTGTSCFLLFNWQIEVR